MPDPPTRYLLVLESLPSSILGAVRLRRGLKYLLRGCALRCIGLAEVPDDWEILHRYPDAIPLVLDDLEGHGADR